MKSICIVGGGYGGIKALEVLAKAKLDAKVTLIDKNAYHYMQTESYNFITSNISLKDITLSLPHLVNAINKEAFFVQDEAISIKENRVICKNNTIEFDYLILAVGSITKQITIFKDFLEVKELENATKIKEKFEQLLLAHLKKKKEFSSIVIIGGGSSGVEIAASMQDFINDLKLDKEISIILIADIFLAELDHKSRKKVLDILQNMGIKVKLTLVKRVQDNRIWLDNEIINFDLAFAATGIEANEFIKNLSFSKENGFLLVDEYLQVAPNIFAVGDCALIKDEKGNILPPTAQIAEQSGVYAAKNVINLLFNKPMQKARIKVYGLVIALGNKFAVAKAKNFYFEGFLASLGKKAIEHYYKIPLKMKINQ